MPIDDIGFMNHVHRTPFFALLVIRIMNERLRRRIVDQLLGRDTRRGRPHRMGSARVTGYPTRQVRRVGERMRQRRHEGVCKKPGHAAALTHPYTILH